MDVGPVITLKRKSATTTLDLCIFCQENTKEATRIGSQEGKKRVKEVSEIRRKLLDSSSIEIIDQIDSLECDTWEHSNILWHKTCYGSFTSESKLTRLKGKVTPPGYSKTTCTDRKQDVPTCSTTRTQLQATNWNNCIFCQSDDVKQLHNVSLLETSRTIIRLAKSDHALQIRLADVHDLIASKGKYHLKCFSKFKRQSIKCENINEDDTVMTELCFMLEQGLSQGHVYDMGDVWTSCCKRKQELSQAVPSKYETRRQVFYDDVKTTTGPKAQFIRPLDKQAILMYPGSESNFVISKSLTKASKKVQFELFASDSGSETDSTCSDSIILKPCESTLLQEMVHVALQIRSDLCETPGHDFLWEGIDKDHVDKVIPESLFLFLRLLFGGMSVLEDDNSELSNDAVEHKVRSIAQDIVFGVSNGTKMTPKHVGLGLALHQATRSEKLINLFHAANHTVGIHTIHRIDNSIANDILERYIENGYIYIPENIKSDTFIHCSCDNIDVLEATIDGRNTFHSTQMVVWQRQTETTDNPVNRNIRSHKLDEGVLLDTMKTLHNLDKAVLPLGGRAQPTQEPDNIDADSWFTNNDEKRKIACIKNFCWLLARQSNPEEQTVPTWRAYNESSHCDNPPLTIMGMLPILQAPADEFDTITTVINRFEAISNHIGQTNTVITVDQPLYAKGKELVWGNKEKYKNVIFRLGGLHICFNFLKAIGQHVESAGLDDMWIEAGIYPPNTTENILEGKAYYRAVRAHILTYEALWRLRWCIVRSWMAKSNETTAVELYNLDDAAKTVADAFSTKAAGFQEGIQEVVESFNEAIFSSNITTHFREFDELCSANKNYMFWMTYMDLVEILFDFIRAEREGNWDLHLESFAAMLPWLTVYDHLNYARWGPVYLAEMKSLQQTAPDIYREFKDGNFVVKRSNNHFSQIPTDQATEWVNKICKMNNGIIGITRNDQARDKFCATWATKSHVSQNIKSLLGETDKEEDHTYTRYDSLPSRIDLDKYHVQALIKQMDTLDIFCRSGYNIEDIEPGNANRFETPICDNPQLVSVATKDVASVQIANDLTEASKKGIQYTLENVNDRLINKEMNFFDPMKKKKSKTFAMMYKVQVPNKQKNEVVKADRKLLQRLLTAANAGRDIQLASVLKHELSPIPLSLAKVGGSMNTTTKAELLHVLTSDINLPTDPPSISTPRCVIVDGHAMIQAFGKPPGCSTFGDYADVFIRGVFKHFHDNRGRVDVVFDRYIGNISIKANTRVKRTGKRKPIRKLITGPDVPLPQVWEQFISLAENKADLARYLSEALQSSGDDLPQGQELVIGGGFQDILKSVSNRRDVTQLSANHEEADTRIILHAVDAERAGYECVVVVCRDTDVFLLLIYHLGGSDIEVWMFSGTAKKMTYYPVHVVAQQLPLPVMNNILRFHALTGCDTTSSFSGISKKTCWKKFMMYPHLLDGIGRDGDFKVAEQFVCLLYGIPKECITNIDDARCSLFVKAKRALEMLPPTCDALQLHVARADYQAKVWLSADESIRNYNEEGPSQTIGWTQNQEGYLEVVWKRLPAVPKACIELITCGCQKKCSTIRCKCFKADLRCTPSCACDANGCVNPAGTGQM